MLVERDVMIETLKKNVIPELREKGFKGSFPHFRRITDEKIDILTFQFDKYGGGFRLELAVCPSEGFTHHWGEKVPPNKVTAYDLKRIVEEFALKQLLSCIKLRAVLFNKHYSFTLWLYGCIFHNLNGWVVDLCKVFKVFLLTVTEP